MFQKFKYTSVVSVRYNDMFFNSGSLNIDDEGLTYNLPRAPTSLTDLCTMLNDPLFMDTNN